MEDDESPFDFRSYTAQEEADGEEEDGSYQQHQFFYTGGGGNRATGGRRRKGWVHVDDAFHDLFNTWKGYTTRQHHNTTDTCTHQSTLRCWVWECGGGVLNERTRSPLKQGSAAL